MTNAKNRRNRFSSRRIALYAFAALTVSMLLSSGAAPQDLHYPNRVIRLVVGTAPGSPLDIPVRKFAELMQQKVGVPIIVENKPGAGGTLAATEVIKSAPDGYTLLVTIGDALISSVAVMKNPPYDPLKDLKAVAKWSQGGAALVANAAFKPNTLQEMVEFSRNSPEPIQYATHGPGTFPHYQLEALAKATGAKLTPVHYRTGAQAFQAVLQNEVAMTIYGPAAAAEQIAAGKLKAYAVQGDTRVYRLPNVPTFAELGHPEFVFRSVVFVGMFAPARTPEPVVDQLAKVTKNVLAEPSLKQFFRDIGQEVAENKTPTEFAADFAHEYRELTSVIKNMGIETN